MRAAAIAIAILVAGCDPEIVSGAYLCGPEMSCPSGLACSAESGECVQPELAKPFACRPGSEGGEPNDGAATASGLAIFGCPDTQVELLGCLPASLDVDFIAVTAPTTCAGAALSIDIRYSAAFAPAVVDLVDASGAVLQTAAQCNITGGLGANDAVCLDTTVPADGRAVIRVSLDPDIDCDGACDYAHYVVTASAAAP